MACQASLEFSRQGYWSGLPFSSPGDHLDPRIEPGFPALQTDSLPSEPPGKPPQWESKSRIYLYVPWKLLGMVVPVGAQKRYFLDRESEEKVKYELNLWCWCNIDYNLLSWRYTA